MMQHIQGKHRVSAPSTALQLQLGVTAPIRGLFCPNTPASFQASAEVNYFQFQFKSIYGLVIFKSNKCERTNIH